MYDGLTNFLFLVAELTWRKNIIVCSFLQVIFFVSLRMMPAVLLARPRFIPCTVRVELCGGSSAFGKSRDAHGISIHFRMQ